MQAVTKPLIARTAAIATGVLLLSTLAPALLAQVDSGPGDLRRPLLTVRLKDGGRYTLRDASFGLQRPGERPPRGSKPPGTPTGPTPGNTPGVGGFGDPGDPGGHEPQKRDPRQPTHGFGGKPRSVAPFLGLGISRRDFYRLRRIDITRVEEEVTYGDFLYEDGRTRVHVPMNWTFVAGWERPGQQGKAYYFEAEEISYLEFPDY